MITIKMTEHSIRMSGHAGTHSESGADRACAAVSALTCNLVNSLHDLTQDKIRAELSSGDAAVDGFVVSWNHGDQPGIQLHTVSVTGTL